MNKKELLDAKITALKEFLSTDDNQAAIERLKNAQSKSNIMNANFLDKEKKESENKQKKI